MNRILFIGFIFVLIGCQVVSNPIKKSLYDTSLSTDTSGINGFNATLIFNEELDRSFWASKEVQCVQYKLTDSMAYSGSKSIKLTWDKIKGGCDWIGIGFGWNNWMAKDFSDIMDSSAICLSVKSIKGNFKNLPVAFAFEDYAGRQNFFGFQQSMAPNGFNDSSWTTLKIPLRLFNLNDERFELDNVKQFLIQLEAEGQIYIDDIKIIKI